MTENVSPVCPSCGGPQAGTFCEQCGEKRITTHDYSVVHFFEHALETFTHFDYRSLRALKLLALRPGELTRAYLSGRRKGFVGPLQMFVILNLVFALLGTNAFRTPLRVQEHDPPFAALKRSMVARSIERRGIERQEFTREFDQNAGVQGKTWIFAMIPAYALILAMLYAFGRYFFEHLVFATHFMAFVLLWDIVVVNSLRLGLRLAGTQLGSQAFDDISSLILLGGIIVYFFVALRRVYGDGKVAGLARALALGVALPPVLWSYRFLLFFVTLKTMH
jgi:hypothetical protein